MYGHGCTAAILRGQWRLEYCHRFTHIFTPGSNAVWTAVDVEEEGGYTRDFWVGNFEHRWYVLRPFFLTLAMLDEYLGSNIYIVIAACVRYDFVKKLSSAQEEYYLLLADSLNWCTIEAYVGMKLNASLYNRT